MWYSFEKGRCYLILQLYLWFYGSFMFLFWLVFAMSVRVCLYVLCGHLLGKGWPLGSRLWCLLWVCHFPIGILGQVWYLIVSIPDLCTFTYFYYCMFQGGNSFVHHLCYFCLVFVMLLAGVCLLMPCGPLLGKGWPLSPCLWCLIVCLSLFHVVSCDRCGTWLYWFLIFALFLTMKHK